MLDYHWSVSHKDTSDLRMSRCLHIKWSYDVPLSDEVTLECPSSERSSDQSQGCAMQCYSCERLYPSRITLRVPSGRECTPRGSWMHSAGPWMHSAGPWMHSAGPWMHSAGPWMHSPDLHEYLLARPTRVSPRPTYTSISSPDLHEYLLARPTRVSPRPTYTSISSPDLHEYLLARPTRVSPRPTYTSISSPICVSCGNDIACRRGSSNISSSSSLVLLLWRRLGGRLTGVDTRFNVRCRRLLDFVTVEHKRTSLVELNVTLRSDYHFKMGASVDTPFCRDRRL